MLEVITMPKNNSRNKNAATSVNKQGLTEDTANQEPKSQLEQRAKKKNTKI
jgi:small acid-soluble spore protein L (minor)